jgi:20S proteasome alpha/beta subunit
MNKVSTTYTKEEAVTLVTKLLQLSMARDGSSGGFARIIAINENGLDEVVVVCSDSSKGEGNSSNQFKEVEGFANIPNDNGAPGLAT